MHEERNDNKPGGKRGGVLAGLFVIAIGLVFLADRLGADLPEWLFTWPMILISLGIFAGIKHGFRPGGWLIMLLIGGIFLADRLYDGRSEEHTSELQSLMRISYAVLCLKTKKRPKHN